MGNYSSAPTDGNHGMRKRKSWTWRNGDESVRDC